MTTIYFDYIYILCVCSSCEAILKGKRFGSVMDPWLVTHRVVHLFKKPVEELSKSGLVPTPALNPGESKGEGLSFQKVR